MSKAAKAILALVLLAISGSAYTSGLSLLLTVDPVRVTDAASLLLRADIGGIGARQVKRSELEVRNAAGKVVFSKKEAFIRNLKAAPAMGYGELPPSSLPPGAYTAIWRVDDLKSNTASFSVGAGVPRALTLEQLENGHGACLLLHIVNSGSKPDNYCSWAFGVNIIVDGRTYKAASGCAISGGGSGIGPREGFSMILKAEYPLASLKGTHKVSAEYLGHRSNEINARCE